MRPTLIFPAVLALLAAAGSAQAYQTVDFSAPPPTQHMQDVRYGDRDKTPYPMSYSDEAAQSLGVKDGHWEAFQSVSTDPMVPTLNGGVDSGGAMIKLQWR